MNIKSGLFIWFLAQELIVLILCLFSPSEGNTDPPLVHSMLIALAINSCRCLIVGLFYTWTPVKQRLRYYISFTAKLLVPVFEEILLFVVLQAYRDLYQVSLIMGVVIQLRYLDSMEYGYFLVASKPMSEFLQSYNMFSTSSSTVDGSPTMSISSDTLVSAEDLNPGNLNDTAEDSIVDSIAEQTVHYGETDSRSSWLPKWLSRSNPPRIEIKNDEESLFATVSTEKIDNKNDTGHAYLRFIDFVEQLDEYHDNQVMPIDKVFARFGVLVFDIHSIWILLDIINMVLLSTITVWTYHYLGIGSLLAMIAVRLFRENYLYDQKVNINYKIALPGETMVLVIVASLYYVSVH